ncbi:CPBP family intramembrane glutamic endopeptidase [Lentzea sp. DG1S-22]|uniref:CPBP family intramembrane glutamic endopeptidase n=1 Tax=Lentzea sp. DG1S-22 TaxID=3108822 RepID=UPI002E77E60E|nr:CPBP family intramembrane glutamic endopeptidase [Lentzea sp. DG1S-22]WVH83310.1 CPBP family intramembrane glutamic endopeptidase [Lentzea sp. DG1S-22]
MSTSNGDLVRTRVAASEPRPPRRLRTWQFLVVVAVYLAVVQGVSALLAAGQDIAYAAPTSIDYLVRVVVVPVGLAIAFTLGVAARLGAWQEVFVSDRPVRRWLVVVPVALLVTVVVITNYPGLASHGPAFALLLLVATLMVGFGEELLFRGIGVVAFRRNGYSEFRVGLWTTLLFGAAHGTNIVTSGPKALVQVVLTSATGLVFYLVLRSTGALVAAMAAHGLWDFSVLSGQVNPGEPWPLVNLAGVVLAVLLLLVLVFRRRITPAPTDQQKDGER